MIAEGNRRKKGNRIIRNFLVVGVFLLPFLVAGAWVAWREGASAAEAPAMITYQGKILVSGEAATTTLNMAFVLYNGLTGGTALYTASGTLPATSTIEVTPSAGLFSVNLGDTGTNSLDPSIFQDNAAVYLEVAVEGQALSPRKRITASPYAYNAKYLDGVGATSTASTSAYIPISDASGNFNFNHVTSTGMAVDNGLIWAQGTFGTGETFSTIGVNVPIMYWYGSKAAFRAGFITDVYGPVLLDAWDEVNVGTSSAAFGANTLANGIGSFAAGFGGTSSGLASFASGIMTTASGDGSFAGGFGSVASGEQSFAIGAGGTASGAKAIVFGVDGTASAEKTIAIGDTVAASAQNAIVIGTSATSSGMYSLAFGRNIEVSGNSSIGFGLNEYTSYTVATSGVLAIMGGNVGIGTSTPEFRMDVNDDGGIIARGTYNAGATLTTAGAGTRLIWYPRKAAFRAGGVGGTQWDNANVGAYSVGMGFNTQASQTGAVAIGYRATASGAYAIAMGNDAVASGSNSVALGSLVTSTNIASFAIGYSNTASGVGSFAVGSGMTVSGNYSFGLGLSGSAYTVSQANTMAIMGGNVGIGTSSPAAKLHVTGGSIVHTITSSSLPTRMGGGNVLDGIIYDIAVQGNYVYAVMADDWPITNNDQEFQIFDVSNPSYPQKVGGVNIVADWGALYGIYVAGRYAYLDGLYNSASSGLVIYDVSNPAAPVQKGVVETLARCKYVSGNYAYCTGGKVASADFSIYDVSDPTNPYELSALDTSGYSNGGGNALYVVGRYAYLGLSTSDLYELLVIDVANPRSPSVVGAISLSGGSTTNIHDIYVSGRYAYVVGGTLNPLTGPDELAIVDISSSTAPTVAAYMNLHNTDVYSIYVSGKYAYVGVENSSLYGNKDLLVIDISSSTNPVYASSVEVGTNNISKIKMAGRYLYVATENAATNNEDFQIYDVSGVDSPAGNFGSLYSSNLTVSDNLQVANNLYVLNGLNVGIGGIMSNGGMSINSLGTTASTAGLAVYNSAATATLYVRDDGRVGMGTSTPEFGLDIAGDGGVIARGTAGAGNTLSTTGAGTRLIWYPRKAAFRAGYVSDTQWDEANIGDYSFAGGLDNKVTSTAGTAFGAYNTIIGDYSAALGTNHSVSGARSVAFGSSQNISGTRSVAFGGANVVSGSYSAAFGEVNTVSGGYSVVFGYNTSATGSRAIAMGQKADASGDYSFAGGVQVMTSASNTFVYGLGAGTADSRLTNNIAHSFMVGFQSETGQLPALFVSGAGADSKVGINTTSFSNYKLMIGNALDDAPGIGVRGYIKATSYITGTTTLDLAETYPVDPGCSAAGNCPEAGDAVCLKAGVKAVIEKCSSAYEDDAVGIVSTRPGLVLGGADLGLDAIAGAGTRLVALAGRVPVRVSGEIHVGDKLTTSLVPGVAMKATREGTAIGIALEDYTAFGEGRVMAFVNVGWNNILYRGLTLDEDAGKITVGSVETPRNLELTGGFSMLAVAENKLTFATTTIFETALGGYSGARAFVFNALNLSATSSEQYLLSVRNNNEPRFSVAANGDVRASGNIYATGLILGTSTNPGDLAERVDIAVDDVAEAGDVVVVDERRADTYRRSNGAYEQAVAGVISTNPTIVVGNGKTDYTAVMAMVGRVPVKVTAENGDIKRGDLLVTASTTGYAMKYDAAKDNGLRMVGVVGVALEPLTTSSTGKIMALIRTGWVNNRAETLIQLQQYIAVLAAGTGIDVNADPATVSVQNNGGQLSYTGGNLDLGGSMLLNVAQVIGKDNKWAIDADGRFITRVATTQGEKEMYAMQSPVSEFVFSGSSQLTGGEARVEFDEQTKEIIDESAPLKVTVTLTSGEATGVFVKEKGLWGFVAKELSNGASAATFDWIVVAKRKMTDAPLESAPPAVSSEETGGGGGSDDIIPVESDVASPAETPTTDSVSVEGGQANPAADNQPNLPEAPPPSTEPASPPVDPTPLPAEAPPPPPIE